jgi:uncharacterized protein (DUF2336 family)
VLFGGQDMLAQRFSDAIGATAPSATIGACLVAALDSAAPAFTPERHDLALQRRAIITATGELRERELLKRAGLSSAIADALRARGADDTAARLAGEMGVLAFSTAFARWAEPENRQPYTEIAHTALRDLQAHAAALGSEPDVRA